VGGGLAGLVAAWEIARRGARVVLLESSRRLGGQIFTQRERGFVIEHGGEGYSSASRAVADLVTALGLTHRTVKQRVLGAYQWSGSELRLLAGGQAASLVGIQASGGDLGCGLVSLAGGMGELVDCLARELAAKGEIRTGSAVRRIKPARGGLVLQLRGASSLVVDRAIAAVPPQALESMVPDSLDAALSALSALPVFSSVSISLAYPSDRVAHPLDAAGMVPGGAPRSGPGFKACVFASSKFRNRSPEGWVLLRVFFRPGSDYPLDAPDRWWVERAEEAVSRPLGIRGPAAFHWVARWERALPLWDQRRSEAVRRLRSLAGRHLGLELVGSHYRRSGIAGAVRSGLEAARRIAPRPQNA
jgi:oxygen-dependent protoporphyrinogen oxidase